MDNKTFQLIFDEVSDFLPEKWDRLVIHLVYGVSSYKFSFYVKNGDEYIKCFNLDGVDDEQLLEAFERIDEKISLERDKLVEKWYELTMLIGSDLDMHADFDYELYQGNEYKHYLKWKNKYLT